MRGSLVAQFWVCVLCWIPFCVGFEASIAHSLTFPALHMSATMQDEKAPFRVLGVCGGIGSGKSTACKLLVSSLDCMGHLDADSVAHSVYSPGSQAIRDIVDLFGSDILQPNKEEIDRKKLGAIVFADRGEMEKLERVVWPHVKVLLKEKIEKARADWLEGNAVGKVPVLVLEAAILLDAGWDDLVDGVWVVSAPRQVALERLMETRGLPEAEAEKRISAQDSRRGIGNLDDEVAKRSVTSVIENKGSLEELSQALGVALKDPKSWK